MTRLAAVLALLVLVGVVSGLAGGVIALQLDGDDSSGAVSSSTPASPIADSDADRVRDAIAEVSPAIVRVLVTVASDADPRLGTTSVGSGIIVDDRGLVLTNYHVIQEFDSIAVVLETGEVRPAELIADDAPFQDVALLRIEPGGLRSARINDQTVLRQGDPVLSIAAGIISDTNQVKLGIISDTDLVIDRSDVILEGMIQTDASINTGDSGGALVNLDGEVVGLVTANLRITPDGEVIEGVGFAHGMSTITPIIESVLRNGLNTRPRYGIERIGEQHIPIDAAVASVLELPVERGALITGVAIGSPAEDGGVLPGDIVLEVNGVAVGEPLPLANLLKTGADVQLTLLRAGEQRIATVLPAPLIQATGP